MPSHKAHDKPNEGRNGPPAQRLSSPTCLLSELQDPVAAGYLSDAEIAELLAQTAANLQICRDATIENDPPRAHALDGMLATLAALRTDFPTVADPPAAPGEPDTRLQQARTRLSDALLRLADDSTISRRLRELRDGLSRLAAC